MLLKRLALLGLTAILLCSLVVVPASAATIDWTNWTGFTTGSLAGSATGTAGGINVSYAGELENLIYNYPSWGPSGTFNGGTVGNAPPPADGIIQIFGGPDAPHTGTITFSQAVTNPVLAIWSLGQGGIAASFQFTATEPFTIESGGPSNEYGGSTITACGTNAVCGNEGNGTLQFDGTFTTLTWTNPVFENWYGFTVGVPEQSTTPVPEPASLLLLGTGLSGLGTFRRRR